ncbi:cation:dicarboxylase symporter family transporter [Solirubrobacter sp. CPCC 204708]|uniref:Cation:dicarboxylase symporter family transporter n=1 Tax=Solirubrobacter deserti TaxID=2282478 RepID=A0ABT4RFX8_9ACTN|nr:cation:dicarboxylase symporter family transporter [Solirubrobacter deserti]MBE2318172.1 cation:dicarboxylase symporter family transporter [Solirubrobacter deserti]MDA0137453.1 cation:dicarboxylase symporter family transporter [Solirubrobacter deserti]
MKERGLYKQLWFWVIIAIALGIVFGLVAPGPAESSKWLADAFIQLIKAVTGPVIFLTVVIGIASLGNLARAGGLALRALAYFFGMTVIALSLGLLAANVFKPGAGFEGEPSESARQSAQESIDEAGASEEGGLVGFITDDLLPTSFVSPFVENEILRVLVLAILVAAAISMLPDATRKPIISVFETLSKIVFGVIRLIMWVAPLGAFGGMAYTVAVFGAESLSNLAALMAVFWGTCAFFVFVVLGAVSRAAGFSIFRLVRLIRDELLIIVGTSSSETVLPRLLAKTQAAGASKQVSGMVLPTGYSFNLDGTCIYLTLGALFIVQATGQDMAIGEQIALAGLMILTSKGAAGITGAGLVTLTASLTAFGGTFFSAEAIAVGIALVVGIDRIMSEGRALTNAIGNTVAVMVIAKWQNELDVEHFDKVLHDPTMIDREVEAAMRGEDVSEPTGRFDRDRDREKTPELATP